MTTRSLPVVTSRFEPPEFYRARESDPYVLLPFRFIRLDSTRYVVTNMVGEYLIVSEQILRALIRHRLPVHCKEYDELKSRHFILDDESTVALDLLATKHRTRQTTLADFTSLFLFVTTLRCDHSCPYCQVSRQSQDKVAFDMSHEIANRAI